MIRDEVLADCVGMCAAFDRYDASLARKLLGLDNGTLRPDARLRHYVPEDVLPQAMNEAALWINGLEKLLSRVPDLSKRQRESL